MIRKAEADVPIRIAPITRDGFTYDGRNFTVQFEEHQVERCDAASLYTLLTHVDPPPVMTKAGAPAKRQPPPFVDRPGWFYCGQLLHYGLKPLKTKEAAKKLLHKSYDAYLKLAIPSRVIKLEEDLKAEFIKANNAANGAKPKKTKTDPVIGTSEAPSGSQPKTKQTARKTGTSSLLQEEDSAPRTKQTARKTPTPVNAIVIPQYVAPEPLPPPPPRGPRTKQTARKSTGAPPARTKQTAVKSKPPGGTAKRQSPNQLVKSVLALPATKHTKILVDLVKAFPGAEAFLTTALAGGGSSSNGVGIVYDGDYTVKVPKISEEWGSDEYDDRYTLTLATSKSGHVWGRFTWGIIEGVIRSNGSPAGQDRKIPSGTLVRFTWRGRETGENQIITMGDSESNEETGTIEFRADGSLKGTIGTQLGKFAFSGTPSAAGKRSIEGGRAISQWKDEYRHTNQSAHESEGASRWGQWVEEPTGDGPEDSDTSDGERFDSEDDGILTDIFDDIYDCRAVFDS